MDFALNASALENAAPTPLRHHGDIYMFLEGRWTDLSSVIDKQLIDEMALSL